MSLTEDQARIIAVQLVQEDAGQTLGRTILTKQDIMAAVVATQEYLDENPTGDTQQGPMSESLPEPFKSNSLPQQRAAILAKLLALAAQEVAP